MASWKAIFILFVVFQVYLIIGMLGFHYLETSNEDNVREETRDLKQEILANFTCLSDEDLEMIIAIIGNAIDNGLDPSNNVTSPSNWKFNSAYFFSGTVITTIGYGHISPSTKSGQSFCIVYALIGIPICGFLLSALGVQFSKLKKKAMGQVYGQFHMIEKDSQRKMISVVVLIIVQIALFIIIPAIIFKSIEGWTYHEAWYYCFISLTTIGFGDFVAGQNPDIDYPSIYKIMIYYWIIIGLVCIAIIIQDISDALSPQIDKIQETFQKEASSGKSSKHQDGAEGGQERVDMQDDKVKAKRYGTMSEDSATE